MVLNTADDEAVDEVLPVSVVAPLNVIAPDLSESSGRPVELEWPQKLRGGREVWSYGVDLVSEVLDALDPELFERG
jgi:hypothetical protein